MTTIFSFYFPILLSFSLSFSFLLHTFIKHLCSLFLCSFNNNIKTFSGNNYNINPHCPDVSSSSSKIRGDEVDRLVSCTKSLGSDDQIDYKIGDRNGSEDDDEDECWRRMRVCEGRRNWNDLKKTLPPPLSSLNQKGQSSFVLVPVRKNGRLQLNEVRIKRPDILHASREDGRLRLYLVPDHCDDVEEEEQEDEWKDKQEFVEEEKEEEEIIGYEKEEDRVVESEWKFHNHHNIEEFRRCHQMLTQCNHHYHHHHHHHNLPMYGVSIA